MFRLAVGMALVAACTPGLADEARSYCAALCRCFDSPLPALQRDCSDDCAGRFEQNPVSEACVACVVEHAARCADLRGDCDPICRRPAPPSHGRDESGIEERE